MDILGLLKRTFEPRESFCCNESSSKLTFGKNSSALRDRKEKEKCHSVELIRLDLWDRSMCLYMGIQGSPR